ncbi:hypothetical protein NDU88_009476 [Pleurodeles waltl]|uniref:Uncharacterized protein n=1 Tax=Pleurodeles waltl TaxID=8319 RepID=A0AAV7PXC4_PLEWA|nr:hypothetical protein NDU88_009476 [Pleurodeles waltl]
MSPQVSQSPRRSPGGRRCYSSVLGCRGHLPLSPPWEAMLLSPGLVPLVDNASPGMHPVRQRPIGAPQSPIRFHGLPPQQSSAAPRRVPVCTLLIDRLLVPHLDFGLVGSPASPYLMGQCMSVMAAAPGRSAPPPVSSWLVRRPASDPHGSASPFLVPVSGYSAGYSLSQCLQLL